MPLGVLLVKVLYKLRFFFHEFLIESVISVPFGALILILLKNMDCGYSLEPHRRGGSNEYPQSMF